MRIHNPIIKNIQQKSNITISFGQKYPNIDTYVPDNSNSRAQERTLPALSEASASNIKFLPVKATVVNGQPVVILKKIRVENIDNQ